MSGAAYTFRKKYKQVTVNFLNKFMGGDNSKNAKEISYDLLLTKYPKINQMFEEARQTLRKTEEIRKGIEVSKKRAIECAKCIYLVGSEDEQFLASIQIFLWTVSAECGGNLDKSALSISQNPVAIHTSLKGRGPKTLELYQHISEYLKAAQSQNQLAHWIVQTREIFKQINSLLPSLQKDSDFMKLNKKERSYSISSIKQNIEILKDGLIKMRSLLDWTLGANTYIKSINVNKLLTGIGDIGKMAAAKKCTIPSEIFDKFYNGNKKTFEQISKEKADERKKSKKKKSSTKLNVSFDNILKEDIKPENDALNKSYDDINNYKKKPSLTFDPNAGIQTIQSDTKFNHQNTYKKNLTIDTNNLLSEGSSIKNRPMIELDNIARSSDGLNSGRDLGIETPSFSPTKRYETDENILDEEDEPNLNMSILDSEVFNMPSLKRERSVRFFTTEI